MRPMGLLFHGIDRILIKVAVYVCSHILLKRSIYL